MFPHSHKVLQTGVELVQNPLLATKYMSHVNRCVSRHLATHGAAYNKQICESLKVRLYLVDIFRHLVDFFCSRHFAALRFLLSLCSIVSSPPAVVQRPKL